ncbi:MAG: hypothetical protein V3T41_05865 [bacterium]
MKTAKLFSVVIIVLAVSLAFFGCDKLRKEKPAEAPISVEAPPAEEPAPPAEEPVTEAPPAAPMYVPAKLDILKMLDDTLGSSEDNLGWDNIYTSISLEKDVELFTMLQDHYAAGSSDRTFIDDSTAKLNNVMTFLDEKITMAEGIDPTGADAKAKKKVIRDIRARVRAMIGGPAPAKKPIPEVKGDEMKKKWKEGGDMKKKKWAERG